MMDDDGGGGGGGGSDDDFIDDGSEVDPSLNVISWTYPKLYNYK